MKRHLNYNPGLDPVDYLEAINCGENRLHILEQLLLSLRAEIGRPNHQHHLLIGPRGSGKTHLLRILTAGRIQSDPQLSKSYLPIVMPEETALRTPGDLVLKFVQKLAKQLMAPPDGIEHETARQARTQCLTALTTAKAMKKPLERLSLMTETLESAGKTLGRILLPIAENMDQTFYLGAKRSRKNPQDEQWAIRRYFQESAHLMLIGAAPAAFGAVEDPGKAFFDFFRTHYLDELSNDEVLKIIHSRLEYEKKNPCSDPLRCDRISSLYDNFTKNSPKLRGLLVITGGLPRFTHLIYEVIVDTDVSQILDTLNGFLDDLTPYFQTRLDPRLIPQAEIDLLHTLALAYGPLQPTEIAEELYGVSSNEVSELLNRLSERGLVKRAGRPGGKAVTWDLTEPLYRVWTKFRYDPDGQDLYQMLAKFVALLFSLPDIDKEMKNLAQKIASLPDESTDKPKFVSRHRLMEIAYLQITYSDADMISDGDAGSSSRAVTAEEVFDSLIMALDNGHLDQAGQHIKSLRTLNEYSPEDENIKHLFAHGLYNAWLKAFINFDQKISELCLYELIRLSNAQKDKIVDNLVISLFELAALTMVLAMKKGRPDLARKGMKGLEETIPSHLTNWIHPFNLALNVLEKGAEKALAREPEEMKRAVRLILEKIDKLIK